MLLKEIYPKTTRISCQNNVQITEKLDGSNLCIFKKDDVLYIAQRKRIISYNDIEQDKQYFYKGLYQWLKDNFEVLNTINNNSVVCGEWLGMGKIKYPTFDKKFYMFAKANIDDDFKLYNINYNHTLFGYSFEAQAVPVCIGIVPVVADLQCLVGKEQLDELYQEYTQQEGRNVEGFVINYNNNITKYVRMKNGRLSEHFDWESKSNDC
jgi:hypothetical protein